MALLLMLISQISITNNIFKEFTMSTSCDKLSTIMQGVDTIVAMPQWYINYNLNNLLQNGTTTTGDSLKNVSLTIGENSWLNGILSQIWTNVYVPESVSKVKFILKFASGTMDYYDLSKVPPVKETADITDLQFGFDVDLSYADVTDNQTLPADVKDRAEKLITSLGTGAFSIKQLLMDFQNAVLSEYDSSITLFPSNFPASAVGAFPTYLNTYLSQLEQAGGNILGYAVKVDNPGQTPDPIATFPPTNLEFVTNQYRPNENPQPSDLQPDLDTVNFLMMTAGNNFPPNPKPWWGNFVIPNDDNNGWYGSLAMANELFVKQFLLPHLAPLVNTYWQLTDANDTLNPSYTLQSGAFTPTTDGLGGTWGSGIQSSLSHQTNAVSNDDAYYNCSVEVNLNIKPGSNQIVISRKTNFDIHYIHWYGVEGHAISSDFHVWYEVTLMITITLLGVQDGKLHVQSNSTYSPQKEPNHLYEDPYGWLITQTDGSYPIWQSVGDTMDTVINNFVDVAMPQALLPSIDQIVTNALDLSPFVFPGGAQLFMANPVFNDEGDLLLGLQYKN
jgi:hypothetical protein